MVPTSRLPNVATMKNKGVRYGEVTEIGNNGVTLWDVPSDLRIIYFMLEEMNGITRMGLLL
ncbi:MAG: hypothetical protein V8S96_04105 [Lachnospiraceae bacterium]